MIQLLKSILHESDDLGHMMDDHNMFWPFGLGGGWMWLLMAGYGIAVILLAIWVYQNAKETDENAVLWALVVFFTMGIGVLVYLLIRRPEMALEPKTSKDLLMQETTSLKGGLYCEDCGNVLEIVDQFCAKCGTEV